MKSMPNEQAFEALTAVPLTVLKEVSLTRGYAYDVIQHFIVAGRDDWKGLAKDDVENVPTDLEAGDLFRTLVLDENFSLSYSEHVYDAAMIIVRSVDSALEKVA